MSNKTRKRLWPASLVMAVAIIGVVAAFLMVASSPTNTQAHDGETGAAHCEGLNEFLQDLHDASAGDHTCDNPPQATMEPTATRDPSAMDMIDNSSTSASAGVKLVLTIGSFPMDAKAGSSVELYLEDDFQVPDSIDRDTVYFTVDSNDPDQNSGGRVYATDPIEIDDDDHYGGDDDWAIQVFIPDMNDAEDSGYDGPLKNQTVTLVFTKAAGIKNPSEEGSHSIDYVVLDTNDDPNDGPPDHDPDKPGNQPRWEVRVESKISLSDEDNDRGYELTVTGSGFNNGTSAAVHVLNDASATPSDKTTWPSCAKVITQGARAGIATVGSDDKVAVTFEVTVPTFKAGKNNYICMVDGEGRSSSTDVEQFELQDSLRVVPATANAGDTVNVFAQDFPQQGNNSLTSLKIAGQEVFDRTIDADTGLAKCAPNCMSVNHDSIGADGSATVSFELPGSISGSALEGTVRIDAKWGSVSEDAKITITGSQLTLSKSEVSANESVTIRGSGFGDGSGCLVSATLSGANLMLVSDDDPTKPNTLGADESCIDVEVSSAGQFAATVAIWVDDDNATNPALTPGTHTIEVVDDEGFTGNATIIIKEPTLTVTPDVAGPRDYVTISGENWPVENEDGGDIDEVKIVIDESGVDDDEDADPDASGRWSVTYRVDGGVTIPSTVPVKASYGSGSEIVRVGSFSVPAANLTVEPMSAVPGDTITLSATGFSLFESDIEVKIGSLTVNVPASAHTDGDGAIDGLEVLVPSLDPALYTVQMNVGDTVTIGELTVMDDVAVGVPQSLPDAVSAVGDNLVAVFYFDDVAKAWSFYDPRPEFADLNTLSEMVSGQAYWILVSETVEDVVLNGRLRSLTCRGDDCWNLEVW